VQARLYVERVQVGKRRLDPVRSLFSDGEMECGMPFKYSEKIMNQRARCDHQSDSDSISATTSGPVP